MTEPKPDAANGPFPAMARARSRLEDMKALSLAASLLAFGGLTATVAVQSASQQVTPSGSTPRSASLPSTISTPDQSVSPDPTQAPAFSAPQQAAVAAPATAHPPIVSAQS